VIQRDPNLWRGMCDDRWMTIGEIVREIMRGLFLRKCQNGRFGKTPER